MTALPPGNPSLAAPGSSDLAVPGPASSASAQLILATVLSQARARLGTLGNPFAGLNSSTLPGRLKMEALKLVELKAYSRPASLQDALARTRVNVGFFRLTYTFVFGLIVALAVVSNFTLFVLVGALGAAWSWFLTTADNVVQVGQVQLKRTEKTVLLLAATVIVIVFGGLLSALFWVGCQCALVIGAHGSFREPVQLDALEELEVEGEKLVAGSIV
jgi:hypothetical protein